MADANGGLKQRKSGAKDTNSNTVKDESAKDTVAREKTGLSILDIFRIVAGLLLLNSLLSYFITNDSFLWGYKPWFVRPKAVMRWIVNFFRLTHTLLFLTDHSIIARSRPPHRCRANPL